MSNYHVLEMSEKEHEVNVIFHITVPNENNEVGINLRTALTQYAPRSSSQLPWIETLEMADIQNGILYEYKETVVFNANLTLVQKRSIIDDRYNTLATVIVNRLRSSLKFWGMDRDVP